MAFQATLATLIDLLKPQLCCCGEDLGQVKAQGVNTDSRSLAAGELFLALRGEQFDGHQFVERAAQRGAIAAIVDHPLDIALPQLQVKNTLVAYQTLANWWRRQFKIPVIGITGSAGKTTTKELIAAVLGTAGSVLKTEANYNNEIGVPKTLLQLTPDHDYAVIEMGMRGPGEIAELTQIAVPDIGVIINVGTAHIGRLGSRTAIAQAKCELLAQMPATSMAILNADQPLLMAAAAEVWQGSVMSYGLEAGQMQGQIIDQRVLRVHDLDFPLPLPGVHNASNFLAALAIADYLKLDLTPLQQGLILNLPSGRAHQLVLDNDVIILDQTYNAGLESMQAALQLLAELPGQRHIAVLGAMKELGDYSLDFHRQVGALVQSLDLDQLFILDTGPEGAALAEGARPVPTQQFADHAALIQALEQQMQRGDRILCKASHAVGLDRVVDYFSPSPTQGT
ncbi:MAG: UDP-N-acetylmuramoyl-tripeptide--D-alanyl-D-alanine ligase [Acaryochloridaceae cyanobacterium SU_2_1]|nr:UDP-N-acetylmuramoyl-tripeptide--D-alanyl-D-alanine ligase [Acaryochloridaceae cyanobacterium SU_2_1]NJM95261.1 UDP-N-acetylmuramoyl-tripeptide--D-alanyl-D-alanine ligase [Acaryochloridaceae cyanobacterium CSU_5_19]